MPQIEAFPARKTTNQTCILSILTEINKCWFLPLLSVSGFKTGSLEIPPVQPYFRVPH
jgi:hypothetical protein